MSRRSVINWKSSLSNHSLVGLLLLSFVARIILNKKYYSDYKCELRNPKIAFIKVKPYIIGLPTPSAFYTLACNDVGAQCAHNSDAKFIAPLVHERQS